MDTSATYSHYAALYAANPPTRLHFIRGNAKLDGHIWHVSLPAGHACPGARDCKAQAAIQADGHFKVEDGPEAEFRCFAVGDEARFETVRGPRWANYFAIKHAAGKGTVAQQARRIADMINASLPALEPGPFDGPILIPVDGVNYARIVRLHVAGDFFSQAYFDAWVIVAQENPDTLVYGYTKSPHLWAKRLRGLPSNMVLTASHGGHFDYAIDRHGLRTATVFASREAAEDAGLQIDHDDSHAFKSGPSFALLLHGQQPARSTAAKAVSSMKASGEKGYSRRRELATV